MPATVNGRGLVCWITICPSSFHNGCIVTSTNSEISSPATGVLDVRRLLVLGPTSNAALSNNLAQTRFTFFVRPEPNASTLSIVMGKVLICDVMGYPTCTLDAALLNVSDPPLTVPVPGGRPRGRQQTAR